MLLKLRNRTRTFRTNNQTKGVCGLLASGEKGIKCQSSISSEKNTEFAYTYRDYECRRTYPLGPLN